MRFATIAIGFQHAHSIPIVPTKGRNIERSSLIGIQTDTPTPKGFTPDFGYCETWFGPIEAQVVVDSLRSMGHV